MITLCLAFLLSLTYLFYVLSQIIAHNLQKSLQIETKRLSQYKALRGMKSIANYTK